MPERDLWETYLPAFKTVVQEGDVAEVMCAYQRIDGQPCCGNTRYEQQILRDEWGFNGLITSDCGAIRDFLPKWHAVSADEPAASAKAVLSGTDVECGSIYKQLPEAVRRGIISEADLDRSLRRLLIARIELGDLDNDELNPWTKIPETVIASDHNKQLAYEMALKSIVLLKNSSCKGGEPALPLDKAELSKPNAQLVVMGPNANDAVMMWGNYAGYPTHTITALEGITKKVKELAPDCSVRYLQGCGLTRSEVAESRFDEVITPLGSKGIQATYWNNTEQKGTPVTVVSIDGPVHLNNGGNTVFAPGVELENFSARLDGVFRPTRDETLLFELSGDDRLRLIVNSDTLINTWRTTNRIQKKQKQMKVKAGQHYRIQIDYVQNTGYGALDFDITKRVVPTAEQLLAETGDAETVIFVGGISPSLEGEEMKVSEPGFRGGDRETIELPQVQRDMLAMLHKAGKKVVYVNCSGSAMALVPELETCDAIVQWWYAGEKGGDALADVLFGSYNPSGKLPITFYKSTDELPDFLDYTMTGRTYRYYQGEALYPFGYGLSYTQFETGKPTYNNNKVQVRVKNTGTMTGTETIQVYLRRSDDKQGPLKSLRAWQQVTLAPGESKVISIALPKKSFEGWDEKSNTIRIVPGKYEIMVGSSSADRDLKTIVVKQ